MVEAAGFVSGRLGNHGRYTVGFNTGGYGYRRPYYGYGQSVHTGYYGRGYYGSRGGISIHGYIDGNSQPHPGGLFGALGDLGKTLINAPGEILVGKSLIKDGPRGYNEEQRIEQQRNQQIQFDDAKYLTEAAERYKQLTALDNAVPDKTWINENPADITRKEQIIFGKDTTGKTTVSVITKDENVKAMVTLTEPQKEELARLVATIKLSGERNDQVRYNELATGIDGILGDTPDGRSFGGTIRAQTNVQYIDGSQNYPVAQAAPAREVRREARVVQNNDGKQDKPLGHKVGHSVSDFFGSVFKTEAWKNESHSGKGQAYAEAQKHGENLRNSGVADNSHGTTASNAGSYASRGNFRGGQS